jgi:soluble lytic murein transglycosylase-like protein
MVETARLLLALCGPSAAGLAPHVDHASRKYHIKPAILVAMARVESTCHPNAVGGAGGIQYGLLQIRLGGSAALGYSAEELLRPRLNLELGARHLHRWLVRCGDIRAALGVFNGWKKCSLGRKSPYAKRVMEWVEEVERGPRT